VSAQHGALGRPTSSHRPADRRTGPAKASGAFPDERDPQLLDATVVRSILVPASMKLLGDWNWYFPKWLEWAPNVSIEGRLEREAAPEPAQA